MAHAVASKPVPIRLAQRYPNGSMVSYSARAIARDEESVRVIVNEEFQPGSTLAIMAPFLDGLTTGRVASVKRSKKQPGYFEIVVRFDDAATASFVEGSSSADTGNWIVEPPATDVEKIAPSSVRAPSLVPEQSCELAEHLADGLEKHPARRFSQVLRSTPEPARATGLIVAIAATLQLLEAKHFIDAGALLGPAKKVAAR